MSQERKGVITFKGSPLTLEGPEIKVGDKAPNFVAFKGLAQPVEGKSLSGKVRFISVVPSLDTPVCDLQTKRFNSEAKNISGVEWLTISADTPMAQGRWCGAADAKNIQTLSDFIDRSFGKAYGVYIKEFGLLARAIFIIGKDDKVKYVELVKEVAEQPNYGAALAALKANLN